MTRTALAAFAAANIVLAVAAPAQAQDYRFDVGINGGGAWYTKSLEVDELVGLNGVLVDELSGDAHFKSGWLTGAQATWWATRHIGVRANFAYNDRPLEFDGDFDLANIVFGNDFDLVESVNLWSGTGDLMIRFLGPRERRFLGVRLLPYLSLGAGAKWINPAGHRNFLVETGVVDGVLEVEDEDGVIFPIGDELFALKKDTKFMGLVALGSDIRLTRHFALRAEVGDRIWEAPIIRLDGDEPFVDREEVGKTTHEIYATLGTHFLFGLEQPERRPVAVAPAPPTPAPIEEEMLSVCVVDPTMTGGLGMLDAVYVPTTDDTLVIVDGERVDIETVGEDVVVASETNWFPRGEPLTVIAGETTAEFVTFGGARIVEVEDLAFLGTVDGLPVYADEAEVMDINSGLLDLADANDLGRALARDEDLLEDFNEIEVLYVPLQPTGCVFQPVRRVEDVRKVRD